MRKTLAVLVLVVFAITSIAVADDIFPNKAFKKYSESRLGFEIYLPKKIKKTSSSLDYALFFKRSTKPALSFSIANLGNYGEMTYSQLASMADDMYWDMMFDPDYDYYPNFDPSPIVNLHGDHGVAFCFVEFDADSNTYLTQWELFIDSRGNLIAMLSMSSANHSGDFGQAAFMNMLNGGTKKLKKPASEAASPAAVKAASKAWKKVKDQLYKLHTAEK